MKKLTSIATALCMATTFCGFCVGCANEIEANNAAEPPKQEIAVSADDGGYKVILCPGYTSGYGSTANTIESGAVKLDSAGEEKYWVSNAYSVAFTPDAQLPTPTTSKSKTTFVGWQHAVDGTVETVTKMPKTMSDDLILYARWFTEGQGAVTEGGTVDPNPPTPAKTTGYIVNGQTYELVENTGATISGKEYWLGAGVKTPLKKGDKVSFVVDGSPIQAYIDKSSVGVDKTVTDSPLSEFTVTSKGEFKIFLKYYKNTGNWVVEFTGPADMDIGNELPAGTRIELNFKNGTVALYLRLNNKDVTSLSGYKIWMWDDDGNFFDSWDTRPAITASMTFDRNITTDTGVIVTWSGNSQTQNLKDFEPGGIYLITLNGTNSKMTRIELDGEE